jgi:hypothetical protein
MVKVMNWLIALEDHVLQAKHVWAGQEVGKLGVTALELAILNRKQNIAEVR